MTTEQQAPRHEAPRNGALRLAAAVVFLVLLTGPVGLGGRHAAALLTHHSVVLAVLALCSLWVPRRIAPRLPLAIAVAVLSVFWYALAPYPYAAKLVLADLIAACGVYALTRLAIAGEARAGFVFAGIAGAAALNVIVAIPQRLDGRFVRGLFANPHHGATLAACTMAMALALALGPARSRRQLVFGFAAATLALGFVVALASRGALLAAVVGAVAAILVSRRPRLVGALVAVVVLSLVLPTPLSRRVRAQVGDRYAFQRVGIWRAAARMAAEHPWRGVGLGAFDETAEAYNFPVAGGVARYAKSINHAHNEYLQVAAEAGLLGLGLLLLAIGRAVMWAIRRLADRVEADDADLWRARIAVPGLAALLAHAAVDAVWQSPSVLYALAALLAVLAGRDASEGQLVRPISWSLRLTSGVLLAIVWGSLVARPWAGDRAFSAYLRTGEPAALRRALRHADDHPGYHQALAGLRAAGYFEANTPERLEATLASFEDAVRLAPVDSRHWAEMAAFEHRAYLERLPSPELAERALSHYREAARRNPTSAMLLHRHASLLGAMGRPQEALALAQRAVSLEPNFRDGQDVVARAAGELGLEETARTAERERRRIDELAARVTTSSPYERALLGIGRSDSR